jgi:ABC-type cobalamin/Fe3+-siderophores transport system ATPase subunit
MLLQKNCELILTDAETSELDLSEQIDTLMGFLKIRARAALKNNLQD